MTEYPAGSGRQSRFGKTRPPPSGSVSAPTLALSPLVWAQNAPAERPGAERAPPLSQGAPVLPQQSFAPLVKQVLPAVVNISVTDSRVRR